MMDVLALLAMEEPSGEEAVGLPGGPHADGRFGEREPASRRFERFMGTRPFMARHSPGSMLNSLKSMGGGSPLKRPQNGYGWSASRSHKLSLLVRPLLITLGRVLASAVRLCRRPEDALVGVLQGDIGGDSAAVRRAMTWSACSRSPRCTTSGRSARFSAVTVRTSQTEEAEMAEKGSGHFSGRATKVEPLSSTPNLLSAGALPALPVLELREFGREPGLWFSEVTSTAPFQTMCMEPSAMSPLEKKRWLRGNVPCLK
mmetsp:Transcript_35212/g.101138  ORF Transcript_35212/g.101138 Transcript_35212/m.101138 type:complete len:258 (-) Transcript_35212:1520-2293(-)